jgi:hypothetical protein
MSYNDSASEIAFIKTAIETVSSQSGVDQRIILCIIMQESGGNVRAANTNNGVENTGLMQAFNGSNFDPADPGGSILTMGKGFLISKLLFLMRRGTSETSPRPRLYNL